MSASKRAKIDDDFEPNQEEEDFSGSIDSTQLNMNCDGPNELQSDNLHRIKTKAECILNFLFYNLKKNN